MDTTPPHDVTLIAKRETSETPGSASSHGTTDFITRDPELHKDTYERLAWTALMYAMAYFFAFTLSFLLMEGSDLAEEHAFDWIVMGLSVAFGIGVFIACRRRLVPPHTLYNFATAYEIIGALGINASAWGWESDLSIDQELVGIPWVCVWILVFPTVMPAAPRRTAAAGTIAALSGAAIMAFSVVVHGLPVGAGWADVWRFIATFTYPAIICAGLAHWTAVLVYKLSREAAKARRMGSYQLVEKIGSGGMGEVWKAKHRLLVRPAAIKLIRRDVCGKDDETCRTTMRRFEREAQTTALLRSPHTVELYDFGMTDEGTFYYVMELLDGLDLKRLVERYGPLPGDRAIHLLRQTCHSLHDAHSAGMVHRDVKPANIFTCRRGQDYDFVKVLDFGLVAASADASDMRTQLTADGVMSGTPAFMAPEMASGEGTIDARTDVYALGCVAYWLLTGRVVFEGNSAVAVILKHARDLPAPPSSRTELPIDPELERIVLACLAKDPDDRPASAAILSQQLEECARTAGAWTNDSAMQWWRMHAPEAGARGPLVSPRHSPAGRLLSPHKRATG
jgi:serine/threonine-protein kinase